MLKDFLLKEGPMRKDQVARLLKEGIAVMGKISFSKKPMSNIR
jgi:hypothetical protein